MRRLFYIGAVAGIVLVAALGAFWPKALWAYVLVMPLTFMGLQDALQTRRAVLRNFPLLGRFRYLFELIRPEINQYFIESNTDGTPFSRERRSVVYQRSKRELDTVPFGTQLDVYEPGYEWIEHSLKAKHHGERDPRIRIGEGRCSKPYDASIFNISAMSFGSLSEHAVLALNLGAKTGAFAHNTGEGGIAPCHRTHGGDLIWQIGTGYFGARGADGNFDGGAFAERATLDQVRMIELKLSQGAKPGHGGILPAAKLTPEIAEIRGVPLGEDVLSPPSHRAFDSPRGLLEFIARLRELSGGKPIGFKLCLGQPAEFLGICKAMLETEIYPDFISVDGGEGGTGAAPLEFSNAVGAPLQEGLSYVHSALVGVNLRENLKIMCTGKVITGFDMAKRLALGADLCGSARGMMLALGCIQARRCNSNDCPVGVATQNPELVHGLDVEDKARRVANFHAETVESLIELTGAAGLDRPHQITADMIRRRINEVEVRRYSDLYRPLEAGALLERRPPPGFRRDWERASADAF